MEALIDQLVEKQYLRILRSRSVADALCREVSRNVMDLVVNSVRQNGVKKF